MHKEFTKHDLIRYIYDEMSSHEAQQMVKALDANWALKEQYITLLESVEILDTCQLHTPSNTSIDIIMNYSRSSRQKQTPELETLL